jgi:hypothetical protein
MLVKDVLAMARRRAALPPSPRDDADKLEQRLAVSSGMAEIMRRAKPEVLRETYILDGSTNAVPFHKRAFSVEALFLEGEDITGARILPQQMQTAETKNA